MREQREKVKKVRERVDCESALRTRLRKWSDKTEKDMRLEKKKIKS